MLKCDASRIRTEKTYYNDHHQKPEVIKHCEGYIENLKKLQKQMKVWKVLSEKDEKEYMKRREWSPYKSVMSVGERCLINNIPVFAHHVDDQGGWEKKPTFHPTFVPVPKPTLDEWSCQYKHGYEEYKCNLELREYGQDKIIYHSGDNPSSL